MVRPDACVWLLLLVAGCGPNVGQTAAPVPTPLTGPHGGPAVPLPDDAGYGEVVIESEPGRGESLNARVAVYFLKSDLKTPLDALPTNVRVKLDLPGGESSDLPLAPEPSPRDPAGTGRFASKPGPYAIDQTYGELTATLGGQAFTKPFADR